MVQSHLKIEHPPFVAPGLDFFDAAPVRFSHPQFHEAKRIVGKTRIAEAHPIAAMRSQVRQNLALDELNQHRF